MTKAWNDLDAIENAVSSANTNLLLIDGNNLAYRYIRRANYNNYSEDYCRTVKSLARSYDALKTIVCFDFGKSYYRLEQFPEYKGNRTEELSDEEQAKKEEFFTVLNKLQEDIPEEVVKLRGIEADDTITYLVERFKSQYEHVWVVSSDKDMIQLVDNNVSIFNIFSRKEITIDSLHEDLGITPSEFMLSRIIEGDTGDNILGIDGIGPKRAQTLAKQYKTLDNLLKVLPIKSKAQYINNLNKGKEVLIRNEQLINLKRYNKEAVNAGKDGENYWNILERIGVE